MRRTAVAMAMGLVLALATLSPPVSAQEPMPALPAPSAPAPQATATAPLPPLPAAAAPPASSTVGLAVVALGGSTDAAWPLARAVYASPSLRPAGLDEPAARVLCGEAPPAGASKDLHDLADTLAAVKGDDAPSRMLLTAVARRLNVRALVVVRVDGGHPTARVFLPETGSFDAAGYAPDPGTPTAWSATAASLARTFGGEPTSPPLPQPGPPSAPALATHEEPVLANPPPHRKAFYETGWFWGALGAAAFAGGAIFFATRDNGDSTIHLQATVPH